MILPTDDTSSCEEHSTRVNDSSSAQIMKQLSSLPLDRDQTKRQRKPPPKKKVCIDESENILVHSDDSCRSPEEVRQTWYTRDELASFGHECYELVQREKRRTNTHRNEEDATFSKMMVHVQQHFQRPFYGVDNVRDILTPELEELMEQLYASETNENLLGLECYIANFVRQGTMRRRDLMYDLVLDLQKDFDNGLLLSEDELAEELFEASRKYSQTGRLMAQLLAIARSRACF